MSYGVPGPRLQVPGGISNGYDRGMVTYPAGPHKLTNPVVLVVGRVDLGKAPSGRLFRWQETTPRRPIGETTA